MKADGGRPIRLVACHLLVLSFLFGCKPTTAPEISNEAPPVRKALRILVVDDKPLATAIEREWSAQSQDPIQVTLASVTEFNADAAKRNDLLIFPTSWLGMLVEQRAIRPLPESVLRIDTAAAREYDWNDILPLIRRQEIRWGMETYAVSFGSPQLLLYYREDLFQEWNLPIPTSWTEYEQVAQQIGQLLNEASDATPLVAATAEPLSQGWAARTLLARSAAYARHRSQYSTHFDFTSMRPLINTPPYVRALKELLAAHAVMPPAAMEKDPGDVVEFLIAGKAAMGLAWPAANRGLPASKVALRFAALPGALDVYQPSDHAWQQREGGVMQVPLLAADGRLGAISRYANDGEFAASFLLWLTDKQQSPRISTRGDHTTLFRESQLTNPQAWVEPDLATAAPDYADVIRHEQIQTQWLMMPRIPGQQQYVDALDNAIRAALQSPSDAQDVLDQVAAEWTKITNELGIEAQRKAYLQDLGIE